MKAAPALLQRVVLAERQRILRELHDGVGASLAGLLCLVGRRDADPSVLEAQVREALDEMRMVVDSLQPLHGDLATVLATLRHRLQPRLVAAGVALRWDVGRLPPLPQLSPHAALQVQRILLEGVTNVLRHARAHQLVVQAHAVDGGGIEVSLTDDGVGLPEAPCARGHGLANMQARAASIRAGLHVRRADGGGTRVLLQWPLGRSSEAAPVASACP